MVDIMARAQTQPGEDPAIARETSNRKNSHGNKNSTQTTLG